MGAQSREPEQINLSDASILQLSASRRVTFPGMRPTAQPFTEFKSLNFCLDTCELNLLMFLEPAVLASLTGQIRTSVVRACVCDNPCMCVWGS